MKKKIYFAVSFLVMNLFLSCGKVPSGMPVVQTGSLYITAMDTALVDTVNVQLNDEEMTLRENPCLIEDIEAGFHRVHVFTEASAGSVFNNVEIKDDEVTDILFELVFARVEGANIGNIAPDFTDTDTKGNAVQLSTFQSRVVLLVFIEYT